jgi:hypothetical protein
VLFQAIPLIEAIHAPARINQLLLARKERVAFGADFNLQVFARRTSGKRFAAGARDRTRMILGMYAFLHLHSPLFPGLQAAPQLGTMEQCLPYKVANSIITQAEKKSTGNLIKTFEPN